MKTISEFASQAMTKKIIYRKDYQPSAFLIDEVKLHFDLQEKVTRVVSQMIIYRNKLHQTQVSDLILAGEKLSLISLKLNGTLLNPNEYELHDNHLIVKNVPNQFELEITNDIFPHENTALSGLYRSKNAYCTQCEAEGFRRITYYLDRPDVLTHFTTTITADKNHYPYLLSNGNLVSKELLENNKHRITWKDPFKKPSYLFALVAGDFDLAEDVFTTLSGKKVAIKLYVEKGYQNQTAHALYSAKQAMKWDEEAYGREYDLDVYMIVAMNDFNMGAMENKGLNIFNTKYILAKPETATDDDYINILSVIGHEYFHNWSGNRVTCRDWFQLSLKEGLTIFRDQSFTEDRISEAVMRIRDVTALRESQFPEDAGPLAHPVRPDSYIEINNFYTATVYNKGAEVLRMLQTILGKSLFRQGMDLYFSRFDGQAVTIEDYIKTMEEVANIDLAQFRLWYSQAGTPTLKINTTYHANEKQFQLTLQQSCPATPHQSQKLPFYIPIRMALLNSQGKEIPLHLQNEPVEKEKVVICNEATTTLTFNEVSERPILSILRHFSAPIKIDFDESEENLLFLFKYDSDHFNRFEACQQYMLQNILKLIKTYQQNKPLTLPHEWKNAFEFFLDSKENPYLLAEMITLPSMRYISEQMDVIDVEAIHAVREFIIITLAQLLKNNFLNLYQAYHSTHYPAQFILDQVGKRQLKNVALYYLSKLPDSLTLCLSQFNDSLEKNMTDAQSALYCLVNINASASNDALQSFYERWKADALVIDKWLSLQAISILPDTLHKIKKILHHPAFDIKNPNKVYSLIGTFAHRNMFRFHAKDGEGYAFVGEMVQQLDSLNPQVAARMVKALTAWKRYDKERQALMKDQLETILKIKSLSSDVYELVIKSLERA